MQHSFRARITGTLWEVFATMQLFEESEERRVDVGEQSIESLENDIGLKIVCLVYVSLSIIVGRCAFQSVNRLNTAQTGANHIRSTRPNRPMTLQATKTNPCPPSFILRRRWNTNKSSTHRYKNWRRFAPVFMLGRELRKFNQLNPVCILSSRPSPK